MVPIHSLFCVEEVRIVSTTGLIVLVTAKNCVGQTYQILIRGKHNHLEHGIAIANTVHTLAKLRHTGEHTSITFSVKLHAGGVH